MVPEVPMMPPRLELAGILPNSLITFRSPHTSLVSTFISSRFYSYYVNMVDILHQPSFSILLEDSEVGGYTSITFPLRSPSQATTPAEILEHFNVTPTHLSLYTPAPRDSQYMPFKDMDSPIVAIKSQRLAKSMMKDKVTTSFSIFITFFLLSEALCWNYADCKTLKESQVSLQTAATSSDMRFPLLPQTALNFGHSSDRI